jgi:hypothetical protein
MESNCPLGKLLFVDRNLKFIYPAKGAFSDLKAFSVQQSAKKDRRPLLCAEAAPVAQALPR